MVNTIDMQDIRYLNLFEKMTHVRTRFCFNYNQTLVFCVPKGMIAKAVGDNGRNIKKMQNILGKRIKVVALPKGIEDAETFLRAIVSPVTFREAEVKDGQIVVSGGKNKAALIGRNKRRLLEMEKITKDFFDKEFKVI